MSIRQANVSVRQSRIIESLLTPMSIREVAEQVGCSYHTARNDILSLQERDLVQITGTMTERGEAKFVSGGKRPMPVYTSKSMRVTAQSIALNLGKRNSVAELDIARHIQNVRVVNLLLMYNAAMGTFPEAKEISQFRKALTDAREKIHNYCAMAEQMLNNDSLWIAEMLALVANDEEFNRDGIIEAHTQYLTDEETKNG